MNVTAVVTTLCNPIRLRWLSQSIQSLEALKFPFKRKLIFAAESTEYTLPDSVRDSLKVIGWEVFTDQYRCRPITFTDILTTVDTEWIFYNEEDIIVDDLPNSIQLDRLASFPLVDGRKLGQLSMTAGGSTFNCGGGDQGDFADIDSRVLEINDLKVVILRDEAKRSAFFVNFPCLFIRTDVLSLCHAHAVLNCRGMGIEDGLSRAYFDLGLDKSFYKASILRSNFLELVATRPEIVDGCCKMFRCLDSQQGSSPLGGSHAY